MPDPHSMLSYETRFWNSAQSWQAEPDPTSSCPIIWHLLGGSSTLSLALPPPCEALVGISQSLAGSVCGGSPVTQMEWLVLPEPLLSQRSGQGMVVYVEVMPSGCSGGAQEETARVIDAGERPHGHQQGWVSRALCTLWRRL